MTKSRKREIYKRKSWANKPKKRNKDFKRYGSGAKRRWCRYLSRRTREDGAPGLKRVAVCRKLPRETHLQNGYLPVLSLGGTGHFLKPIPRDDIRCLRLMGILGLLSILFAIDISNLREHFTHISPFDRQSMIEHCRVTMLYPKLNHFRGFMNTFKHCICFYIAPMLHLRRCKHWFNTLAEQINTCTY